MLLLFKSDSFFLQHFRECDFFFDFFLYCCKYYSNSNLFSFSFSLCFSKILRLQPLIYPTHTLLGHSNLLQYTNANSQGLSPAALAAAAAAHYTTNYDFIAASQQYNPSMAAQLDVNSLAAAAAFPYTAGTTTSANSAAVAAAAAAGNPAAANMANYATYAALAQQAIAAGAPSSLATAYQQ